MGHKSYLFAGLLASAMALACDAAAGDLVSIYVDKHKEAITITVDDAIPHKVFTLPNPDRLVVDVPSIDGHPNVDLPSSYRGGLIRKIRLGQFDPDTSRLVFDLAQPVHVQAIHEEDEKNGKLVIDIVAAEEQASKEEEKPRESRQREKESPKDKSAKDTGPSLAFLFTKPDSEKPEAPEPKSHKAKPPEKEIAKKEPPKKEAKEKKDKKITAAKKPSKPIIVIDPGHGGVDPGTSGPRGSEEKNVVLEYARALKAKLLKSGRYQVILTRENDSFIMLRKRVAIARKAGANIFISLHADSAPELAARGLSVYTVSEKSSDEEAEALAARENKADVLAGMDLSDERDDVAGILISLAERETKNRSATLADQLVTALDDKVHLLPNSHRFAGFAVLKAPDIPSVLVEIGFLSHPQEEKLIRSRPYREKVVSGIASGIDHYFRMEKTGEQ